MEDRLLRTTGLNAITALYQNGFNPTSLQVNASTTLAGSHLRLTDGGPNETGSAYYTRPVDVTRAFSTTFTFQLTPEGNSPLGPGFAFELQNENGPSTYNNQGNLDSLGVARGAQIAIGFETYATAPASYVGMQTSDNGTGLYIGSYVPSFAATNQIDIPKDVINLHSGHVFSVTISYNPPTSNTTGTLTEQIQDTVTNSVWSHVYDNVDIQSIFQLKDVTGQYAYAGFTGTTGAEGNPFFFGNGQSTQDILSWQWHDGTEISSMPYAADFTLPNTAVTSGSVFDANGALVQTLWQAQPLASGQYNAYWDGLDQFGSPVNSAINPGPYRFQVTVSANQYTSQVIANDTTNPTVAQSSFSGLWMNSVVVAPDGSKIWVATTNGDTAGGGYVKQLDSSGVINASASNNFGFQQIGEALTMDSQYLYEVAEIGNWSGEYGIFKTNLATGDSAAGFTDLGHTNPDGSQVTQWNVQGYTYGYISVVKNTTGYHQVPGIAVTNPNDPTQGSLWVTDIANNLVHRYDKVTGDQIGTPLSIQHPTGIAVDASGNLWIAHGANGSANVISIYSSSGVFLRDVSEVTGLQGVLSLSIVNSKLYVADNAAGRGLVYNISGTSITNGSSPLVIGGPATYGHDDGRTTFWDLRSITADLQGNIYTVQESAGLGETGSQVEKWSSTGSVIWVKGGYEYQSVGGISTPDNPTVVYSSSLRRYSIDPTTGTWSYLGSAVYAGYNTNPWAGFIHASPASSPLGLKIAGNDFIAMPDQAGDHLVFLRVGADGYLTPASAVGELGLSDGNLWSWSNSNGNGNPGISDIQDSGRNLGPIRNIQADASGNIWFEAGWNAIWKLPLQGVDSQGNPVYNWSAAQRIAAAPSNMQNMSVGTDGIYVTYVEPRLGPESSNSLYAGFSMGGSNAVCKLTLTGQVAWSIPLPSYVNSIDVVPGGGGAFVGSFTNSVLYRIDSSGQLCDMIDPITVGDTLDYGGSLVVTRNPNDGLLDVFTEGIAFSDTPWYRVNDKDLYHLQATAVLGSNATLLPATLPAPAVPTLAVADDTGTLGDNITTVIAPHFIGYATPGCTVQLLAPGNAVLATTTAAADTGAYTISGSLLLGKNTLTISISNAAGTSASSQPFVVTIVASPSTPSAPSLSTLDDSGTLGDGITNVTMPRITGNAPAGLTVNLLSSTGVILATAIANATGVYTLTPTNALPNGANSLTVVVVDAAGNISSRSAPLSLTISTTTPSTPAAPMLLAADDSGVQGDKITNIARPRIKGNALAGQTVNLLSSVGAILATAVANATGAYTLTPTNALPNGSNSVKVVVIDTAGNISAPSAALTLTIMTTPPATPNAPTLLAADDSGIQGDNVTNVARPRITGNALAGLTVNLLSGTGSILATSIVNVPGTYTLTPTSALPNGLNNLTVVATDVAGNISAASAALALTIATTAPTAPSAPTLYVADDSGVVGDNLTNNNRPRIAGIAAPNSTLQLLNTTGTVIATGTTLGDGSYVVQVPSTLNDGSYTYRVRTVDGAGNQSTSSASLTIQIDTVAPATPSALTLLTTDDSGTLGDRITNVNMPRLTGTAAAGSTVNLINASGTILATTTAAINGSFTLKPSTALSDGTVTLRAQVVDAAGNISQAGAAYQLTILTQVPAAPTQPTLLTADDSGTAGDNITNVARPRITGTATAGLTVELLSSTGTILAIGTANGSGIYTLTPNTALPNGANNLSVIAIDAAGNTSPSSVTLPLTIMSGALSSLAAPSLLPADDSGTLGDRITNVTRPRITGSAPAGMTVELLSSTGTILATGTASVSSVYVLTPGAALPDGANSLSVIAIDAAGNISNPSTTLTLTILSTPPAAPSSPLLASSDDSGVQGDGITNVTSPQLIGTAPANTSIMLVSNGVTIGTGSAGASGTYAIRPSRAFASGTYTITAIATDIAGNISSASSPYSLTVITTAPAAPSNLTLASSDDSGTLADGLTNVNLPHLTGSTQSLATVQLINAGTVIGTAVADANGTFSVQPSTPLADGTYRLTFRAVDQAGNVSAISATLTLTIKTSLPSTPTTPTLFVADDSGTVGDRITNVNQPRLTGTADPLAFVKLLDNNGNTLATANANATGAYTLTPTSALPNGLNLLKVISVDAAGNTSLPSPALSLTIQTTPPAQPSALSLYAADDSGVANDGITNVAQPRLAGTATPFANVTILDANQKVVATGIAGSNGSFLIKLASPLPQGTVALHARVTDVAANVSADGPALSLTIMTASPSAPTLGLLAADDTGITGDKITTVRAPRLTGIAPAGSVVQLFDSKGNLVGTTNAAVNGTFTIATNAITAGTFGYTAKATDIAGNTSAASAVATFRILTVAGDFTGDLKADTVTYNPQNAVWTIRSFSTGQSATIAFGWTGVDVPVPADYDGVGKTEVAVYRPGSSDWFIFNPNTGVTRHVQFGQNGDIPVPGDYDGVGKTEIAVYRPSTAQWFILNPTTNTVRTESAGWAGADIPVPADYDGAGRTQIAVYRPTTATFYIRNIDGSKTVQQVGNPGNLPIPADYDGDGKVDMATYSPANVTWTIDNSSTGQISTTSAGQIGTDQPVPLDYEGTGKANVTNYRLTTATYFIRSNTQVGARTTYDQGVLNVDQPVMMPLAFRLNGVKLLPVTQNSVFTRGIKPALQVASATTTTAVPAAPAVATTTTAKPATVTAAQATVITSKAVALPKGPVFQTIKPATSLPSLIIRG